MMSGGRRYCDVCDQFIFDNEAYYEGEALSATALDFEGDPKNAPSFTPLPDGRIRFEICQRCVGEAPDLLERLHLKEVASRR